MYPNPRVEAVRIHFDCVPRPHSHVISDKAWYHSLLAFLDDDGWTVTRLDAPLVHLNAHDCRETYIGKIFGIQIKASFWYQSQPNGLFVTM